MQTGLRGKIMNVKLLIDATKTPLKYFDLKDVLIVKTCMKKPLTTTMIKERLMEFGINMNIEAVRRRVKRLTNIGLLLEDSFPRFYKFNPQLVGVWNKILLKIEELVIR